MYALHGLQTEMTDNKSCMTTRPSSAAVMTSRPVYVTSSAAALSFGINAILATSSSKSSVTSSCVTSTLLVGATASHLTYGSALTAAAIAASERAAAAAFHHRPASSSSSSAAVAAASLWAAAAAAAAAHRHTFIPGVMTSSNDYQLTSIDRSTPDGETLMPPVAAIFPWMQERKDRVCGTCVSVNVMNSETRLHRTIYC